jgi:hypothetical protein
VYRITIVATHVYEVSEDKLRFVQNIAPDLTATLRGITGQELSYVLMNQRMKLVIKMSSTKTILALEAGKTTVYEISMNIFTL